ncbi:NmrA-like family domain-containing protein [Lachnellula suecica]|uniref:NmrA-like family domain-containing protein n=1 Tax=Lachnellula suecica TaxID=602035 RepID=A0A8T9CH30_9HELO|nr:NmrA-like family domain-containing protein [Lachnellula suecica]
MTKLICIIGVTGNQGGSVAQRFLEDKNYKVRGVTRNPASPAAQKLAAQGVEIVKVDLDDVKTLVEAFKGANIIFSVTNYWEPFFRPDCRAKAAEAGVSCRKFAYDVELQQGKNIADAAAEVVGGLDDNGLIASTLSHAGKSSNGAFKELYHFDAKADIFPGYVNEKHPKLAAKMSCVQTGFFTSSHKLLPEGYFRKTSDGTFQMSFPTTPDALIPQLEVNKDTGAFVYAVSQMPPGKDYIAEGERLPWPEFLRIWGEIAKVPTKYQEVTLEQFVELCPDKEFGRETGDMFLYSSNPGYDGGDPLILKAADIEKAGIKCPMTSVREHMEKQDWTSVLNQ